MSDSKIGLILFFSDNTLCGPYGAVDSLAPRESIRRFLVAALDAQVLPLVGVMHYQPLVGMRYWLLDEHMDGHNRMPTAEGERERVAKMIEGLPLNGSVYTNYAWAYLNAQVRRWGSVPHEFAGSPDWSRTRRPPHPGLIEDQLNHFNVRDCDRDQVLVVGRSDAELAAAKKLGVRAVRPLVFEQVDPYQLLERFVGASMQLSLPF